MWQPPVSACDADVLPHAASTQQRHLLDGFHDATNEAKPVNQGQSFQETPYPPNVSRLTVCLSVPGCIGAAARRAGCSLQVREACLRRAWDLPMRCSGVCLRSRRYSTQRKVRIERTPTSFRLSRVDAALQAAEPARGIVCSPVHLLTRASCTNRAACHVVRRLRGAVRRARTLFHARRCSLYRRSRQRSDRCCASMEPGRLAK